MNDRYNVSVFLCNVSDFSKRFAHFGWYVGIKKTGRGKNGRKTWYPWGQKAIRFVARKPSPEPHPVKQLTNRHGMTLIILNNRSVKGIYGIGIDNLSF